MNSKRQINFSKTDPKIPELIYKLSQTIERLRARNEPLRNTKMIIESKQDKLYAVNNLHDIYAEANCNLMVQYHKALITAKNDAHETEEQADNENTNESSDQQTDKLQSENESASLCLDLRLSVLSTKKHPANQNMKALNNPDIKNEFKTTN